MFFFFLVNMTTTSRRSRVHCAVAGNPSHKTPRYRRSSTYSRAPLPPPGHPLASRPSGHDIGRKARARWGSGEGVILEPGSGRRRPHHGDNIRSTHTHTHSTLVGASSSSSSSSSLSYPSAPHLHTYASPTHTHTSRGYKSI